MSDFKQTKANVGNHLAGGVYGTAVIGATNGSRAVLSGQEVATFTQMEFGTSHYQSGAVYGSHLSAEEVLLLHEKEALTKAVEAVRLRREAVSAARLKTEEEVSRLVREDEARRHATAEALRSSATERLRVRAEETAARRMTENLEAYRAEAQATRERPQNMARKLEEVKTPTRLHERLREQAFRERQKTEPSDNCAAGEISRIAEPMVLRNKAIDRAQELLSLEQRLRAEIEGQAEAQRRNVDAARAQVSMLRNTAQAHAPSAR